MLFTFGEMYTAKHLLLMLLDIGTAWGGPARIVIHVALALLLIYRFRFFTIEGLKDYWISGLFGAKLIAAFFLVIIYTYYYENRAESDIYRYFDDGGVLYNSYWQNKMAFFKMFFSIDVHDPALQVYYAKMYSWNAGISNIATRVNALLCFISGQNIFVHCVWMSFLSTCGFIYFYKWLLGKGVRSSYSTWLYVTALPSLLMWSSVVLKDGVLLTLLCFLVPMLSELRERKSVGFLMLSLMLLAILAMEKLWLLFLLLPGAICILLKAQKARLVLLSYLLCFIALGLVDRYFLQNFILKELQGKQEAFFMLVSATHAASAFPIPKIGYSWWVTLADMPLALLNAFTRPWLIDADSMLEFLSGLESMLITVLFVYFSIFLARRRERTVYSIWLLLFTMAFLCVVGLLTPVAGALVRYRMLVLPFLFGALLMAGRKQKNDAAV